MPKLSKSRPSPSSPRKRAGKRTAKNISRHGRERSAREFFASFTLEQLAKAQGVSPIKNPKQMVGAWPEDEDVDQFLLETYQTRG
jgi:hypothetical protein